MTVSHLGYLLEIFVARRSLALPPEMNSLRMDLQAQYLQFLQVLWMILTCVILYPVLL